MSGAPKSTIREIDLSTRVQMQGGVYGGIVLPASKGAEIGLVTGETQFLREYTANEKVTVGMDLSYFSALQYLYGSNKLWVSRATASPKIAGLVYENSTTGNARATKHLYPFEHTFQDGEIFVIHAINAGRYYNNLDISVHSPTDNTKDLAITVYDDDTGTALETIDNIVLEDIESSVNFTSKYFNVKYDSNTSGSLGTLQAKGTMKEAFEHGDGAVYSSILIKHNSDEEGILTSTSVSDAYTKNENRHSKLEGATVYPEGLQLPADTAFLIHASSVGSWANNVHIAISTKDSRIKEPSSKKAFLIDVFKGSDLNNPVETFIVSRIEGMKDGYKKSLYIEDVLKRSGFIRAVNNPLVDETYMPMDLKTNLNGEVIITPVPLSGGDDGTGVSTGDLMKAADRLKAKQSIKLRLIMDGGLTFTPFQKHLIDIAETRKDCIAILSAPQDILQSYNYMVDTLKWINEDFNPNTSYAAIYSPHVKVYDKDNDREIYISPSGIVGALLSKTADNYELWYPVGGSKRGKVNALDLMRRYTDGELDALYDNRINPLKYMTGQGITVEGQKTLQAYASSLDRLNVRLMLIVVEEAVSIALETFKFELNTSETRTIAKSIVDSFMESIKARKGVYDYQVICDSTNNTAEDIDNHKLNLMLLVKPTQSIEYVETTVVVTRTGMDFKTAASAV
ncbi:phage tail sheath protein FI [Thiovulum sp. ES]|nr:phage tail sheath protein FI [Thiovulum sp. ES]